MKQARVTSRYSRAGWGIFFVCFAIAAAAVNTGNNLLYLLLALLIAAHPVSWWWARRCLLSLEAEALPPEEARAGVTFDVPVRAAAARHRVLAGLLLEVEAAPASAALAPPQALALVGQGESATLALPVTLPRRGDAELVFVARSPFPFGLLDFSRRLGSARVCVLPVPDPAWRQEAARPSDEGRARPERGRGAEIFDIREHRAGDDARFIDWKATARRDRLMAREFAREDARRALIVVDAVRVPAGVDRDAAAERAISRAAAAVEELADAGWRVALLLPDGRREGCPRALLGELARLSVRPDAAGEWWKGQASEGEALIVFRSSAS